MSRVARVSVSAAGKSCEALTAKRESEKTRMTTNVPRIPERVVVGMAVNQARSHFLFLRGRPFQHMYKNKSQKNPITF